MRSKKPNLHKLKSPKLTLLDNNSMKFLMKPTGSYHLLK